MQVMFRVFRSKGFSDSQVESTAKEAAQFAALLSREQIINISQVMDGHIHIITVWYWDESDQAGHPE